MNINATLLGEIITFAILIWFTAKYIWPIVIKALDDRARKISEGLAAAQKGVEAEASAQKQAQEEINNAKKQAAELMLEAQKRITQFEQEEKEKARAAAAKIIEEAKQDIQSEIEKAKDLLRQQVATLAVSGAEQILKREIDQEKHAQLLNMLKSEL